MLPPTWTLFATNPQPHHVTGDADVLVGTPPPLSNVESLFSFGNVVLIELSPLLFGFFTHNPPPAFSHDTAFVAPPFTVCFFFWDVVGGALLFPRYFFSLLSLRLFLPTKLRNHPPYLWLYDFFLSSSFPPPHTVTLVSPAQKIFAGCSPHCLTSHCPMCIRPLGHVIFFTHFFFPQRGFCPPPHTEDFFSTSPFNPSPFVVPTSSSFPAPPTCPRFEGRFGPIRTAFSNNRMRQRNAFLPPLLFELSFVVCP